jgi:hypothetical protein
VLALLGQLLDLDQDDPGATRQVVTEMARERRCGRGIALSFLDAGQSGDLGAGDIAQGALCLRRELANRLDLVAEELQAEGRLSIGRKDVENATAPAELAW